MPLAGKAAIWVAALMVLWEPVAEARITSPAGYFSALRHIRVKFHNIGTVCEQVARIDLEHLYDRQMYIIDTNVEYGVRKFQAVGELDVVIFDRLSGRAVRIYEIKCWMNDNREGRAVRKAEQQRKRFFNEINFGPAPDIWSKRRSYSVFQFRQLRQDQYMTGGPRGAVGFDYQMPLSQPQLEQLFREISDCQRAGDCAQP